MYRGGIPHVPTTHEAWLEQHTVDDCAFAHDSIEQLKR
jgi:hypothetical protein